MKFANRALTIILSLLIAGTSPAASAAVAVRAPGLRPVRAPAPLGVSALSGGAGLAPSLAGTLRAGALLPVSWPLAPVAAPERRSAAPLRALASILPIAAPAPLGVAPVTAAGPRVLKALRAVPGISVPAARRDGRFARWAGRAFDNARGIAGDGSETVAGAEGAGRSARLARPIETFRLENGLEVVVQNDPSTPLVAVSLTYKVGSQSEEPGRSGFAHLFEHLMAQGSKNLRPREITELIARNGGSRNAFTTRTNTTYTSLIPKNALEVVLWAEADRMAHLDINARALALEKQVVIEEMRRNYLNKPYAVATGETFAGAAFSNFANRHTTIGTMADVRDATLADVKDFHTRHYAPNNAVLTLAGDITAADARRLAEKHFGGVAARAVDGPPDVSDPAPAADKTVVHEDHLAKAPKVLIGWRMPERGTRDYWALTLFARLLGGEAGPLYRSLVKGARAALSVSAGAATFTAPHYLRGPELFHVEVDPKEGVALDSITAAVGEVLARAAAEGPGAVRLAAAKAVSELSAEYAMDSLMDRATRLSTYAAVVGDPRALLSETAELLSVTAGEITGAVRRWLVSAPKTVLRVVPTAVAPAPEAPYEPAVPPEVPRTPEEAPPEVGPMKTPKGPKVRRFSLSNGLKVLIVPEKGQALTNIKLLLNAGSAYQAEGEAGLASAAADLLASGTEGRDAARIEDAIRGLGFDLDTNADQERMAIEGVGLTRNAGKFLELLADLLTGASFPEGEVRLWKDQEAKRLKKRLADPSSLSNRRFWKNLFPGHPFGAQLTQGDIEGITAAKVKAFHEAHVRPEGALLVITGDLTVRQARTLLEGTLGRWRGRGPALALPEAAPTGLGAVSLVDQPGSVQADFRFVSRIPIRTQDPDFPAFEALNHILGGGATGRLFKNLRVDKGYTYGAYSMIHRMENATLWLALAQTRSAVTVPAIRETIKEIRRMRTESISPEVLADAKRHMAGLAAMSLASLGKRAEYAAGMERLGVDPETALAERLAAIEALTPEDIREAARRFLDPGGMSLVVTGDRAALEEGLRSLGMPVTVYPPSDEEPSPSS